VAALLLGVVALVVALLALLDIARREALQTGTIFTEAAVRVRWTVVAEALVVLAVAGLVVWRIRGRTMQLIWLAGVVWILALFDFILVGMAGTIPS
jgi:hypothetical protein